MAVYLIFIEFYNFIQETVDHKVKITDRYYSSLLITQPYYYKLNMIHDNISNQTKHHTHYLLISDITTSSAHPISSQPTNELP